MNEPNKMYSIEFVFGHDQADGKPLSNDEIDLAEEWVAEFFARCFGGSQQCQRRGSYLADDGLVTFEKCSVLLAHTFEVKEHWDALYTLACDIAVILRQECVLMKVVLVDGWLIYVKPEGLKSVASLCPRIDASERKEEVPV